MKLFCFCLLSCAGLFACAPESGKDRAPEGVYVVDLDCEETDSLSFSSVFDGPETIILDTNEVLLGRINKIQVCPEGILVLDQWHTKGLYLFAHDGKLIRRIGHAGNGPGEYTRPEDFTLDTANKVVYVLDSPRQRVNAYDIVSGGFTGSFDIRDGDGAGSDRILYCNGELYADAQSDSPSDSCCLLRRIDIPSGKTSARYFDPGYNKGFDLRAQLGPVFHQAGSGDPLFTKPFMDTVYSLGADGVRPYLVLKSKNLFTPADLEELEITNFFMKLLEKKKIYRPCDFWVHDGTVVLRYLDGNGVQSVRLDLATGKSVKLRMYDDMLFVPEATGIVYPDFGCAADQGVYYCWTMLGVDGIGDFGRAARDGKLVPGLDKLEELKKMQLGANPVILFYPYKK